MNTGQTSKNIFTYPTYVFVIFISVFFPPTTFSLQGKISIEKQTFFPLINGTLFYLTKHLKLFLQSKINKFLRLLEKPQPEVVTDEKKLKYFISKVSIWDYFSLTEQAYKYSLVEKKTNVLNRYYTEFYQKYYESGYFYLFFILSGCLLSAIFCLCLTAIFFLMVF